MREALKQNGARPMTMQSMTSSIRDSQRQPPASFKNHNRHDLKLEDCDVAISPPSDLVLDVVKAADPLEVQAAQEKLKANQAAFAANSLAEAGKGFTSAVDVLDRRCGRRPVWAM
jgi:hypothetical protein